MTALGSPLSLPRGALPDLYPPSRSNLVGLAKALPDLHRHVPASMVCLITLRRGVSDLVRVDTVEVLHVRHLFMGAIRGSRDNTSPRD